MEKIKVYISGPISGIADYRANFADAEQELTGLGYEVVNPVTVGDALMLRLKREPTYDEYMADDLEELAKCDNILLLDGWENSKGARIEWNKAKELGIDPIYI
jgi:hypothetical protein